MLAAPVAALAGIGIVSMWELYKEGGWKAWLLPASLLATGAVHILMLSYFINSAYIVKILMGIVASLTIGASAVLGLLNLRNRKEQYFDFQSETVVYREDKKNKLKKALIVLALTGILATPFVGSAAAMYYGSGGSFPAAGLELYPMLQRIRLITVMQHYRIFAEQ
jgi:4-amino-4-deoxy-L-arabinose transferase-like glycosyltransferase